ncbi:MAG: hypothetical protein AABX75_01745 [Nanoarchaeota archaeon]
MGVRNPNNGLIIKPDIGVGVIVLKDKKVLARKRKGIFEAGNGVSGTNFQGHRSCQLKIF